MQNKNPKIITKINKIETIFEFFKILEKIGYKHYNLENILKLNYSYK
jgi:hypothetical protein